MDELNKAFSQLSPGYYGIVDESDAKIFLECMKQLPHPEKAPVNNSISLRAVKIAHKFGHHVVESGIDLREYGNPTARLSPQQLLWIFYLGAYGIKKIRTGNSFGYKKGNLPNIECHLFMHNARITNEIADMSDEKTDTTDLLKIAYSCFEQAGRVKGLTNPLDTLNILADRMYSALEISKSLGGEESLRWLRKSYGCSKGAIAYSKNIPEDKINIRYKKKIAYLYAFSAGLAEKLSVSKSEDKKVKLMLDSIRLDIRSAELTYRLDLQHSAISRSNAARKAMELYHLYRGGSHDDIAQHCRNIAISNYTSFKKMFEKARAMPKNRRASHRGWDRLYNHIGMYRKVCTLLEELQTESRKA